MITGIKMSTGTVENSESPAQQAGEATLTLTILNFMKATTLRGVERISLRSSQDGFIWIYTCEFTSTLTLFRFQMTLLTFVLHCLNMSDNTEKSAEMYSLLDLL